MCFHPPPVCDLQVKKRKKRESGYGGGMGVNSDGRKGRRSGAMIKLASLLAAVVLEAADAEGKRN